MVDYGKLTSKMIKSLKTKADVIQLFCYIENYVSTQDRDIYDFMVILPNTFKETIISTDFNDELKHLIEDVGVQVQFVDSRYFPNEKSDAVFIIPYKKVTKPILILNDITDNPKTYSQNYPPYPLVKKTE